jgi:molybdopterin molybdotransferase
VRPAGSDFARGDRVCAGGDLLDERHLVALAALGVERVSVRCRPRVALIATGSELSDGGGPLEPGKIRDSSTGYLRASLARLGAEPRSYGLCGDDTRDFRKRLDKALSDENDVVIATGAVSAGTRDFIPAALAEAGADVLFHGVAQRPGKPLYCARLGGGTLFFGLPGNPVSTAVGLRFFVAPVLRRLLGRPDERPLRARLAEGIELPEALACFLKARAWTEGGELVARALPGQASYQLKPLLDASAWVFVDQGRRAKAGDAVDLFPFWPDSLALSPSEAVAEAR